MGDRSTAMVSISSRKSAERAALIHREVVQLVALTIIAVLAFFLTRAVATNNRALSVRNAGEWYRRGEQFLAAGQLDEAVDAFRRATVRNRTNRTYLLALSRASARKRDYDSARNLLLTIRAAAPEDPEINLELARLSAARQDVTESIRFFHDALYAPWPSDASEKRRGVRLELIRFLLTHNQSSRAQAELLAASVDMPDDAAHHGELAELFNEAGDPRNALTHFQHALREEPENPRALAGAGRAAFALAEYPLAKGYLDRVPADDEQTRDLRQLVGLVLSRDPIAGRIGTRERRERLAANVSHVEQRLAECLGQRAEPASAEEQARQHQLEELQRRLRSPTVLDQDAIEAGVDLVDRTELQALAGCGPAAPVDRALLLIARRHGAMPQ